jgi:hypothetical protein
MAIIIKLVHYTMYIIVSVFIGLIAKKVGHRSFCAFMDEKPFPFGRFQSVFDMMGIYIWSAICACFLGSPVILLGLDSGIGIMSLVTIVIVIVAILRFLKIIDVKYQNQDIVTWICVATSIFGYLLISGIGDTDKVFKSILLMGPQDGQIISLLLILGSFTICTLVEFSGFLIQKATQLIKL